MLEDLEEGDILHFKNGVTKVKKVEMEKVKVGRETKMKITTHFPNDSDNSKCDLDYWFYEKNGELCGGVRSFLNIIKVEKPQKQKEDIKYQIGDRFNSVMHYKCRLSRWEFDKSPIYEIKEISEKWIKILDLTNYISNSVKIDFFEENFIKISNCSKEFDASRPGFYKTKDGRIAEFLSTEANGREDNLLFRVKVGPRMWMGYEYLKNGCYLKTEIHENDLVEYLGTELPKPKTDPKKYEFETKVIRIGKHMRFDDEPYFYVMECPKELWTKKFKVTMEEILE